MNNSNDGTKNVEKYIKQINQQNKFLKEENKKKNHSLKCLFRNYNFLLEAYGKSQQQEAAALLSLLAKHGLTKEILAESGFDTTNLDKLRELAYFVCNME